jgi:cell division control protein 24
LEPIKVLADKKLDKQLYTIQIFWKGDPGVENFVIRFTTEEMMNKWRDQVTAQKLELSSYGRSSGQSGTSDKQFTSMEKASLENPYLLEEDADEDDSQGSTLVGGHDGLAASRNASNSSLRGAATLTGASMLPPTNRAPPPRYPQQDLSTGTSMGPLTLRTNIHPNPGSPNGELAGNSYFSPTTAESPKSSRSSSQATTYQFSPQPNPDNGWRNDDNKHKTAPAMGLAPSRDGIGSPNFSLGGRVLQGPSLTASQNAQYVAMAQLRSRSASTPDIHNHNGSGPRRYANGQLQAPMDSNPVPPLPSNLPPYITQHRGPVNRSQNNSPVSGHSLIRSATQSPQLQRDKSRLQPSQQEHDRHYHQRQHQQANESRLLYKNVHPGSTLHATVSSPSPGLAMQPSPAPPTSGIPYPSHLKVKIWFDPPPSHVTIVVTIVIKYQSLADRIDSKMTKITSASIASGTAALRYRDDHDLVVIESDEDVRTAIETWGELHEQELQEGKVPDFELLWREIGTKQISQ